ncbi:MAG TPA: hypothetical protein VGU43_07465 [Thermoplasmata archaeon]|nr:hypothetical protein [Thermoplasmata archaeon]
MPTSDERIAGLARLVLTVIESRDRRLARLEARLGTPEVDRVLELGRSLREASEADIDYLARLMASYENRLRGRGGRPVPIVRREPRWIPGYG